VHVMYSDLNRLDKADRRQRSQLNRSSSLLDLSTTARRDQRAAGSQPPSASAVAKPVPNSQLETRVGSDLLTGGVSSLRRRATLDVATSRRLLRMSLLS